MATAAPVLQAASFSPDGKTLLTGGLDGALALWDVATGRRIGPAVMGPAILTAVISADGTRWASGDAHGSVTIHDAASRKELATWRAFNAGIQALAVSPDGRWLATGVRDPGGTTLRVWKIDEDGGRVSPSEAFSDDHHISAVYAAAFSPDSRSLAVGGLMNSGFSETVVYDLGSARPLTSFAYEAARALAFSPDAKTLASGEESGKIGLWDIRASRRIRYQEGHSGIVSALRFSADGRRLVSGSIDGAVAVWDVSSGASLLAHTVGGIVLDALFIGSEILVAAAPPAPKALPLIVRLSTA